MLYNLLALYKPIKSVITISNSKAFKNKNIILIDKEILFLENCLEIVSVFTKATTKLQAEKYPTIYYLIPLIYQIYKKLEALLEKFKVSFYFYFLLNKYNKNRLLTFI